MSRRTHSPDETAPVMRPSGQDAGLQVLSSAVGQEVDEAAGKATAPCTPDLRGERMWPPDSAPYPDPCFQNTVPPSQTPQHDKDTRSPVYFGHFSPFGHFILLFLLNKKTFPRPDVTPTVSVVCSSCHNIYISILKIHVGVIWVSNNMRMSEIIIFLGELSF